MTAAQLRAWLLSRGCRWPGPYNAGLVDYTKASALAGYSISALKGYCNGRKRVPVKLAERIAAMDRKDMGPTAGAG